MTDRERPRQPRGKSYMEGDDKRSRRTPAGGVAIPPIIEEELTPPPMSILDFSFDTAEGPEQKLDILFQIVKNQSDGLEKVWQNRHNRDQIDAVRSDVSELTQSVREFLLPAIKTLMGRVGNLETIAQDKYGREQGFYQYEWPQFKKSVDQMMTGFDRVTKDVDRIERAVQESTGNFQHHVSSANQRYDELKNRDEIQEVRIRKLEDFTLEWKVKVAMYSTGLSGIVAIAAWLINKFA